MSLGMCLNQAAAKVLRQMQLDLDTYRDSYTVVKEKYNEEHKKLKEMVRQTHFKLDNLFAFCERVFGDGQEILLVVTELTVRPYAALFIGKYGCDPYFRHHKNLLFYERKAEIIQQIQSLELD